MYATPIARLIEEFAKMPGIGKRTAERLAYYVLKLSREEVEAFAEALVCAKEKIIFCPVCQSLTEKVPCDNKALFFFENDKKYSDKQLNM